MTSSPLTWPLSTPFGWKPLQALGANEWVGTAARLAISYFRTVHLHTSGQLQLVSQCATTL